MQYVIPDMKKVLSLFLFILTFAVSAQNYKIPDGTWVSDSVCKTYLNDTLLCDDCCETYITPFVFTFIDGKLFCEEKSDSGYYMLDYRMKHNKLRIIKSIRIDSDIQFDENRRWNKWFPEKYSYKVINDSSFILINTIANCKSIIGVNKAQTRTYRSREDILKKYQQKIDSATVKEIVLVKNDSTLKKVILKTNGRFELNVDSVGTNGSIQTTEYRVEKFASIKDPSVLFIYPSSIYKEEDLSDGYNGTLSKGFAPYRVGFGFIPVTKDNIRYLTYFKPGEYGTLKKLTAIGWMSFISALFVAPLVSLEFSPIGFNSHRYLKVAGASLLTMTISFSIKPLFNGKQYLIGNGYGKNGWHFE